jgi:hypothetical protein
MLKQILFVFFVLSITCVSYAEVFWQPIFVHPFAQYTPRSPIVQNTNMYKTEYRKYYGHKNECLIEGEGWIECPSKAPIFKGQTEGEFYQFDAFGVSHRRKIGGPWKKIIDFDHLNQLGSDWWRISFSSKERIVAWTAERKFWVGNHRTTTIEYLQILNIKTGKLKTIELSHLYEPHDEKMGRGDAIVIPELKMVVALSYSRTVDFEVNIATIKGFSYDGKLMKTFPNINRYFQDNVVKLDMDMRFSNYVMALGRDDQTGLLHFHNGHIGYGSMNHISGKTYQLDILNDAVIDGSLK